MSNVCIGVEVNGSKAYRSGLSYNANPHAKYTAAWWAWLRGWVRECINSRTKVMYN